MWNFVPEWLILLYFLNKFHLDYKNREIKIEREGEIYREIERERESARERERERDREGRKGRGEAGRQDIRRSSCFL